MQQNTKTNVELRTIFFGTPEISAVHLDALLEEQFRIVEVVTQPDTKKGKEKEPSPSPVKQLAQKHDIPVFQPARFDTAAISHIEKLKPDLIVVVAYGKILPKEIVHLPGFGAINVHASLLPAYRGSSPIQNVIFDGQPVTGITIMLMDEGMDTGDILTQESLSIGEDERCPELSERLATLGKNLLTGTLHLWIQRKIEPRAQDSTAATYRQLIEKEDGRIFWNKTAQEIYNAFRAFDPWPGIFTFWKNDTGIKRIKLTDVKPLPSQPQTKYSLGEVFQIGEDIGIQTADGALLIQSLQIEGKSSLNAQEFVRGYPTFLGSVLQ